MTFEREIITAIKDSEAPLLLVALGAPRQDIWIHENLKGTGVRVAMGVGGLFAFILAAFPVRRYGCGKLGWNGFSGSLRNRADSGRDT